MSSQTSTAVLNRRHLPFHGRKNADPAGRNGADPADRKSSGVRAVLQVRNFRLYMGGQIVSLTGTWMQRVAQDWLVLELTNSAGWLGVTTALQFGPALLFSPLGGILADRYDKRKVMICTQSAMGAVAGVLGILTVAGVVQLWQVLVLALLLGIVSTMDSPVRQSFVVEMVGKEHLSQAVALNASVFNSARIIGPLVSGVLITAVGTGWSFVANSVSSVGVIAALALMRPGELFQSEPLARAKGQIRAGARYVRSHVDLWVPMALMATLGTFGYNFQFTMALMAKQVFHGDAASYGILTSALAVGALAGSLLATLRRNRPGPTYLITMAVLFSLLEIACGLAPVFIVELLLLLPIGVVMLSLTTAANASVQLGSQPQMRGRVMALYLMSFMGGTMLGGPVIGFLAELLGARWSLIGGGLLCLVGIAIVTAAAARAKGMDLHDVAERGRNLVRGHGRVESVEDVEFAEVGVAPESSR